MRNTKIYCFLLVGLFLFLGVNSAEAVSTKALIEHAEGYDGQIVGFKGEVIGDIMRRGDFAWVNVSDGHNAIGVWMPFDVTTSIKFAGDYKHRGDYIEILGEFHRACIEHHGELDIHVTELVILKQGEERPEIENQAEQKTAFAFLGVAICLGILKVLIERYKKT